MGNIRGRMNAAKAKAEEDVLSEATTDELVAEIHQAYRNDYLSDLAIEAATRLEVLTETLAEKEETR